MSVKEITDMISKVEIKEEDINENKDKLYIYEGTMGEMLV